MNETRIDHISTRGVIGLLFALSFYFISSNAFFALAGFIVSIELYKTYNKNKHFFCNSY